MEAKTFGLFIAAGPCWTTLSSFHRYRVSCPRKKWGAEKVSTYILVVDDEPDVENLFRQQFRRDILSERTFGGTVVRSLDFVSGLGTSHCVPFALSGRTGARSVAEFSRIQIRCSVSWLIPSSITLMVRAQRPHCAVQPNEE